MHTEFYGLHEHPFQMTPNARLYFASSVHRRAHAHLTYGLAQHEGFIIVTGEVGAGKTTLIERLCEELDPHNFVIARITTTLVSGDDVLRMVADAFGAEPEGNKAAVLRGIAAALRHAQRRHLLIVDEAQGLVPAALEELRMLSNLTHPGQPPLQTLLMGQPQLRRLLGSPALAQLRQRVLASYHLGGLSVEETHAYVMHRLRAVGWAGRPSWEPAALDLVHAHSDGLPRRINRLCARVMLSGALEGRDHLTAEMVAMVAQELEEDLGGGAMMRMATPRGAALAPQEAVRADPPPVTAPMDTHPAPAFDPPGDALEAPVAESLASAQAPLAEAEVPPPAAEPRQETAAEPGQELAAEPPRHLAEEAAQPPPAQMQDPCAEAPPCEPTPADVSNAAGATPSDPPVPVEEPPAPAPVPSEPPLQEPPSDVPAVDQPPVREPPAEVPPVEEPARRAAPGQGSFVPAPAASEEAEQPDPRPQASEVTLPPALVPMSFAVLGAGPRTLRPDALIPPPPGAGPPPAILPMLTSEAEVMFDTLTRPPPAAPVVPSRRREEEPERLFNWVFKLLPNNRSRR